MYIQPSDRRAEQAPPFDMIVPKNYSGNAFRSYEQEAEAEHTAMPPPDDPPHNDLPTDEMPPSEASAAQPSDQDDGTIPAWNDRDSERKRAPHGQEKEPHGGILSRLPFLSSLLPPPRGKHKKDGAFPEWIVIAAVILLFFSEDSDNDILPFLLLLLLWN